MKQLKFIVPIFDVDVVLIQVDNKSDNNKVCTLLKKLHLFKDLIFEISDNIMNENVDGGITCYNKSTHQAIIVFYEMESDERKEVCYNHEKRHLEDHILNQCSIDDGETAAYLSGFLSTYFRKLYNK